MALAGSWVTAVGLPSAALVRGQDCAAAVEPNDAPEAALPVGAPGCASGTLDEGDLADHFMWTLGPDQADQRWSVAFSSPEGTPGVLRMSSVASDTSAPTVTLGATVTELRPVEGTDTSARSPELLLSPGLYLFIVTPGAPWSGAPTSYRFDMESGTPMPPSDDQEPNDDPATAVSVEAAFELSGDAAGSLDHFVWQVGEPAAPGLWTLEAQGAIGSIVPLTLSDADGLVVGDVLPEADGTARLPDLDLAPGTYTIRLGGPVDGRAPYILRASYEDRAGADPEPNDDAERALALVPGQLRAGRLVRLGDQDGYRLSVDAALGSVLLDARLIVRSGPSRRLCLLRLPGAGDTDPTPRELSCDDGEDVASLPGLLLQPAEYLFAVSGVASPDDPYYLRVDTSVAPVAGFETEPNDSPDLATAMTPEASLSGRLDDPDHIRVHIDGEPQLWQVEARGPDVRLMWERTDGAALGIGTDPEGSGGRSVLTDVYLIPGDHWLRLDGTSEYTLELVPLGPPVPGGELESNDELSVAEPLPMDDSMTGRIGTAADADVFGFSLATTEHVGIRLEPPAGASLWLYPDGDTAAIVPTPETPTPGEAIDLDLVLPAGNHAFRVVGAPTQERYRISLSRLDPYAIPGDQEPSAAVLPVEMDLVTATPEVAAFESLGQQVSADLSLTNSGAQNLDLRLDATTSEPDWSVGLDTTDLFLGPGEAVQVAITIWVPPQAWSDRRVRATVRARGDTGQATTFIEITPRATAPLVAPIRSWSIPDELLGGLAAAATGLGAVPLVAVDPAAEAALYDGLITLGGGMDLLVPPPLTLSVDLAGEDPVPVAGTILDPSAGPGVVAGTPRDFELALSEDGVTYQTVLTGQLSGALAEQAFVLPEPVLARYAQLHIRSVHRGSDHLRFGEWTVVATPGWQPGTQPLDLAEPARGGRIAWLDPQPSSLLSPDAMLDEDAASADWLVFDRGSIDRVTWVLGFQDGRAAQVTELQWQDPAASDPNIRLERLLLAGSMDGPLGPWAPLGSWDLVRDQTGAVAPFAFEAPTWARYIRMSGAIPNRRTAIAVELPGALRVLERTPSQEYRSVAGEWGSGSSAGPYEWQQPIDVDGEGTGVTNDEGGQLARDVVLEPGAPVDGRVARGDDPASYVFAVPEGQRRARIAVSGRPTVGVGLLLFDSAGSKVPMAFAPGRLPGTVDHEATVIPGQTYRLLVEQPPFSVVIVYDTSASISGYVPIMSAALRSYTRGIVPGEEAVQIIDLEADPFPDEFSDDPWLIQSQLAAHAGSQTGSSNVEIGLIDAVDLLSRREGARAIFLSTDAETASFLHNTELWHWLELVRPQVFATQVGGSSAPLRHQQLMQSWAASGGGVYEYVRSAGTMERAFDRMATWLRRPADYGLVLDFSEERPPPAEPGRLSVMSDPAAASDAGPSGTEPAGSAAESDVAIELVLDTSGSMRKRLGRQRRIDVAKAVLARLVAEQLAPGTPLALRTFRPEPRSCESDLVVPLVPLDPAAMGATIDALEAVKTVQTPLAAAIASVADDLATVEGPRLVVVVSDGRETCGGDPEAAVQALIDEGFDVSVNVVGLGLDRKSRREVARLAEVGRGTYYDARDADGLAKALKRATGAPFVVLDAAGVEVGRGTVDGPPVELPPGSYRATIVGAPSSLGVVTIESGDQETIIAA